MIMPFIEAFNNCIFFRIRLSSISKFVFSFQNATKKVVQMVEEGARHSMECGID